MPHKPETEDSKRRFTRYYFGDTTIPLQQQTGGLVVTLMEDGLLFDEALGRVIIKDISAGGAGVLASSIITVPKKILIVFPKDAGIKTQKAHVVHMRQLNPALNFYGIQWDSKCGTLVSQVRAHWGHLFDENDPEKSDLRGLQVR